jgi:hypothetical protein
MMWTLCLILKAATAVDDVLLARQRPCGAVTVQVADVFDESLVADYVIQQSPVVREQIAVEPS